MIFVDTSAMYAWSDAADRQHGAATRYLAALLERAEPLVTHNHVVVEALTLVQRRLSMKAALTLEADVRLLRVEWIGAALHAEASERWRRARRPGISFVDQVSFLLMRRLGVDRTFAFDRDFEREGFRLYRG